jgi:hypothetical protein
MPRINKNNTIVLRNFPDVIHVKTLENHILLLRFENGENKAYDMEHFFNKGVYKKLKHPIVFNKAKIENGTVKWPFDLDISQEELYLNGTKRD